MFDHLAEAGLSIMPGPLAPGGRAYLVTACAQSCLTQRPRGLQPARFLCPWDSPGKNAGVGCHFLLQGLFPTEGSNPQLASPALAGGLFTYRATCDSLTQLKLDCPPDCLSSEQGRHLEDGGLNSLPTPDHTKPSRTCG